MKKKIVIIIGICLLLFISVIHHYQQHYHVNKDDCTLIIPTEKKQDIINELNRIKPKIKEVIDQDSLDGYRLGNGIASLSPQGIQKIITILKETNSCIHDEQEYYNLSHNQVFYDFYNDYKNHKESSFVYYQIMQSGNIQRQEFVYQNEHCYILESYIDFVQNNECDVTGYEIEQLSFDEYGYFSFRYIYPEIMRDYGGIEYQYIKITPIDSVFRNYNRQYIQPIGYYCQNLFTINWNQKNINDLYFPDLFEYIYALRYDTPFYGTQYPLGESYIRYINENDFENLICQYFQITPQKLRQCQGYCQQKRSYEYNELSCIESKWETPEIFSEIVDAKEENHILTLTVHAMGYEDGYSLAFTHIVKILKKDNGDFYYLSNTIPESPHNQIPDYQIRQSCH